MKKALIGMVAILVIGIIITILTTYNIEGIHTVNIEDVVKVGSNTDSKMKINDNIVHVGNAHENSLAFASERGIEKIAVKEYKNVLGIVKYKVASVK